MIVRGHGEDHLHLRPDTGPGVAGLAQGAAPLRDLGGRLVGRAGIGLMWKSQPPATWSRLGPDRPPGRL